MLRVVRLSRRTPSPWLRDRIVVGRPDNLQEASVQCRYEPRPRAVACIAHLTAVPARTPVPDSRSLPAPWPVDVDPVDRAHGCRPASPPACPVPPPPAAPVSTLCRR